MLVMRPNYEALTGPKTSISRETKKCGDSFELLTNRFVTHLSLGIHSDVTM